MPVINHNNIFFTLLLIASNSNTILSTSAASAVPLHQNGRVSKYDNTVIKPELCKNYDNKCTSKGGLFYLFSDCWAGSYQEKCTCEPGFFSQLKIDPIRQVQSDFTVLYEYQCCPIHLYKNRDNWQEDLRYSDWFYHYGQYQLQNGTGNNNSTRQLLILDSALQDQSLQYPLRELVHSDSNDTDHSSTTSTTSTPLNPNIVGNSDSDSNQDVTNANGTSSGSNSPSDQITHLTPQYFHFSPMHQELCGDYGKTDSLWLLFIRSIHNITPIGWSIYFIAILMVLCIRGSCTKSYPLIKKWEERQQEWRENLYRIQVQRDGSGFRDGQTLSPLEMIKQDNQMYNISGGNGYPNLNSQQLRQSLNSPTAVTASDSQRWSQTTQTSNSIRLSSMSSTSTSNRGPPILQWHPTQFNFFQSKDWDLRIVSGCCPFIILYELADFFSINRGLIWTIIICFFLDIILDRDLIGFFGPWTSFLLASFGNMCGVIGIWLTVQMKIDIIGSKERGIYAAIDPKQYGGGGFDYSGKYNYTSCCMRLREFCCFSVCRCFHIPAMVGTVEEWIERRFKVVSSFTDDNVGQNQINMSQNNVLNQNNVIGPNNSLPGSPLSSNNSDENLHGNANAVTTIVGAPIAVTNSGRIPGPSQLGTFITDGHVIDPSTAQTIREAEMDNQWEMKKQAAAAANNSVRPGDHDGSPGGGSGGNSSNGPGSGPGGGPGNSGNRNNYNGSSRQ